MWLIMNGLSPFLAPACHVFWGEGGGITVEIGEIVEISGRQEGGYRAKQDAHPG